MSFFRYVACIQLHTQPYPNSKGPRNFVRIIRTGVRRSILQSWGLNLLRYHLDFESLSFDAFMRIRISELNKSTIACSRCIGFKYRWDNYQMWWIRCLKFIKSPRENVTSSFCEDTITTISLAFIILQCSNKQPFKSGWNARVHRLIATAGKSVHARHW